MPIKLLSEFKKPIIWRLSDSWAFSGGCHVPFDCSNYVNCCGNCPQLNSKKLNDLSRITWNKKNKYWKNCNITIVAPSTWMANCVKESALFRHLPIKVIFPGIDTKIFRPRDKRNLKQILNLDVEKRYILFAAIKATDDINKGFDLLRDALLLLRKEMPSSVDVEIIILGSTEPIDSPDLGFKCNYFGRVNDEITMALYYSIAEVFVLPSLLDNSPNTVIESLSCGIPVVAFSAGGTLDMIDHKVNGYLATPYSVNDLCIGLDWVLNKTDEPTYLQLAENARNKVVQKFNIVNIAKDYVRLYEEIDN